MSVPKVLNLIVCSSGHLWCYGSPPTGKLKTQGPFIGNTIHGKNLEQINRNILINTDFKIYKPGIKVNWFFFNIPKIRWKISKFIQKYCKPGQPGSDVCLRQLYLENQESPNNWIILYCHLIQYRLVIIMSRCFAYKVIQCRPTSIVPLFGKMHVWINPPNVSKLDLSQIRSSSWVHCRIHLYIHTRNKLSNLQGDLCIKVTSLISETERVQKYNCLGVWGEHNVILQIYTKPPSES